VTAPQPPEVELWRGKPGGYPVLSRSDAVLVPFNLVAGAVAAIIFVVRGRDVGLVPTTIAAGIISVLILGYLVVRLVLRQLVLRAAEYAVTDQHVVTTTKVLGRDLGRTVPLDRIGLPVLDESEGGTGTIRFGGGPLVDGLSGIDDWSREDAPPPPLVRIPDARRVHDLIVAAQAGRI